MISLPVLMLVVILGAIGAIAKSPTPSTISNKSTPCAATGNTTARISRADLAWLIEVPVGSDRASMMRRLGTPYCFLHNGNDLIKVTYPGAWEPSTWIVVIYQGDRYAGYDLSYGNPEFSRERSQ
jgi:hypothetical protein